MAKRFTDSAKWDDPWFAELPLKYKLFWLYILDECDHAGVWKVNFRKASFMIGEPFEQAEVLRCISDRIMKIDESYWLVLKFVKFQYGTLGASKVSKSALVILEKHGLTDFINENIQRVSKGLAKGYLTLKDKDTDKDKVFLRGEDLKISNEQGKQSVALQIENATDYKQLIPIWNEYRKTKGAFMTLTEMDVINHEWAKKKLSTLKQEMLKSIENGWRSLVVDKHATDTTDPNAGYYGKELT